MENRFLLPSSPFIRCQDRFDLVASDEYDVPFWELLTAILKSESSPVHDIASLLETLQIIAVTLRGTQLSNYDSLFDFMTAHIQSQDPPSHFFTTTWPFIVKIALEMPTLFPEGTLPNLSSMKSSSSKAIFSRQQIACLVAHQFMCSLPPHTWNTESFLDLSPWYSRSSSNHQGAVNAYLTAVFTYFESLAQPVEGSQSRIDLSAEEWPIIFTLRTIQDDEANHLMFNEASSARLSRVFIQADFLERSETAPSLLGLPHGACVISANKCFGFGPTGTQEELHVGTSPEAYPAVLLAKPLSDNQILTCQGAEAIVSIRGYGRDAVLDDILHSSSHPEDNAGKWKYRTMLFMDALEMDIISGEDTSCVPDIHPSSRMTREMILKAYNAFRGGDEKYDHIVTGLWGCGAFGGNKQVKCLLQWCAASLAQVPVLRFILAGKEQKVFAEELRRFALRVQQSDVTIRQILDALASIKDCSRLVGADDILRYVLAKLAL